MRLDKTILTLALCAMMTFFLVCGTNLFATEDVTIIGTVYAAAWDENENVTEAVIACIGREYIVINDAVGGQLLTLDGADVKVTGVVGEDDDGNWMITVTKYEIMTD